MSCAPAIQHRFRSYVRCPYWSENSECHAQGQSWDLLSFHIIFSFTLEREHDVCLLADDDSFSFRCVVDWQATLWFYATEYEVYNVLAGLMLNGAAVMHTCILRCSLETKQRQDPVKLNLAGENGRSRPSFSLKQASRKPETTTSTWWEPCFFFVSS